MEHQEHQERLKAALADRYQIEREIGSGGMASVYLAQDLKHVRQIAVKVLRSEVAASLGTERFLAEIRLTARLQHPHIVPLFDSGEADGFLYYVMPYIDGESLRARLEREGPLPVEEVLAIARPVAQALADAHQLGVIHRDIKPENILLSRGQPFVTDFGIARAVSVAGGERLTATGVSVGTPAYMSPEQVLGEESVDARSDVYSLGCVIYEMLSGKPPFGGATVRALLARRLTGPPPHLTNVPSPVDEVVRRSLATAPQDRFATALALADALVEAAQRPAMAELSIVVLPFENLSPDPDQEYFADGLTEEVISDLSAVQALRVIARTSAMTFKGSRKRAAEIAGELNVRYVLEGSVRRAGNSLRITAQLIDGATDTHLWAEKYSGTLEDVFEIQESLARRIVDGLKVTLSPAEDDRIAQRPIEDLVAYDCYLRAKQEIPRFTVEAVDRAIDLLEKALKIEGPNESIFAALGRSYLAYLMPLPLRQDESVFERAMAYAARVFDLNPDSVQGHALKGMVLFFAMGAVEEATRHLKEAHRLDPNNADALFGLVGSSMWAGHLDAGRRYFQKLTAVDPWSGANPGWIEYYSGRFEAAVEGYRKEYEVDPSSPYTRWAYACVLAWAGQIEEGAGIFESVAADMPESTYGDFAQAFARALKGEKKEGLDAVTPRLLEAAKPHWQLRWMMASLFTLLERDADALDWLELAINRGFINFHFIQREPFLIRLHSDARFLTLVEEAKRRSEAFAT